MRANEFITEKWSAKYKRSINCANPKGFSQRAHCAGRKKNESVENIDALSPDLVRRIQNLLNQQYGANLDVDGKLGPLTLQSINEFLPKVSKASAPDPSRTTAVQGLSQKQNPNELAEDLKKWFKEKWVRFNPQGKIMGPCARGSDKEGKPKCLPQRKAHALGKKGRASAAAKKRREDPNPERRGPAKNVATRVREAQIDEKCWKGYHKEGNKELFGKTVPNCVKNKK